MVKVAVVRTYGHFAAGLAEVYDVRFQTSFCGCIATAALQAPAFVGNDYFCNSGLHSAWNWEFTLHPDSLWDGQDCNSSCCQLNNPPYFSKTLPAPTNDDIELRLCSHSRPRERESPIELYVQ